MLGKLGHVGKDLSWRAVSGIRGWLHLLGLRTAQDTEKGLWASPCTGTDWMSVVAGAGWSGVL